MSISYRKIYFDAPENILLTYNWHMKFKITFFFFFLHLLFEYLLIQTIMIIVDTGYNFLEHQIQLPLPRYCIIIKYIFTENEILLYKLNL